jgi:hypothetical protein
MSLEMPKQDYHTMEFIQTHENGVDELYCSICGRRMLLSWPPNYQKVILEIGDEFAIHSAGKGGLHFGNPQIRQTEESDTTDGMSLQPWLDWMKQVRFDRFWDQEG